MVHPYSVVSRPAYSASASGHVPLLSRVPPHRYGKDNAFIIPDPAFDCDLDVGIFGQLLIGSEWLVSFACCALC